MLRSISLIFILFILSQLITAQDVHIMTLENYQNILTSYDYVLIDFFLPWCGPCQKLAPEFSNAASRLKILNKSIALAQVNANEQQALVQKFTILEYPTLKFFAVGIELPYKGGDTDDEIYKWMRLRAISSTRQLKSIENIEESTENNEMIIIYFGKQDECFKIFEKVTKTYDNLNFAHSFEPDVNINLHSEETNKVVLIKKENKFINSPENFNFNELRAFINRHQTGVILPLDKYNAYKIFDEGKPGIVLLLDDTIKSDQALEDLRTALLEPELKETFIAYFGDYKETYPKTFMDLFGIQNEDLPQIRIVNPQKYSKNVDKFEPPNTTNLSAHFISIFCKMFISGALKKVLKSQPIPQNNYEKIKILVGKTFESIVFDDKKDVLVDFYAPWCQHCQQFENIYRELAENIEHNQNIILAKIDATQNEMDGISINGYPTIKLFPAKSKNNPIDYSGNRDLPSLVDFLKKHSSFPWINFSPNPDQPIELVWSNIEEMIYKSNKPVLVNYYAHPCGFCKQMDPVYRELTKQVKLLGLFLEVARIDGVNYKIGNVKVRGFPTIVLFNKDKENPTEYQGDRSLEDFLRFIKENLPTTQESDQEDNQKIIKVDKHNFNQHVYDENKDFVLFFYKNQINEEHNDILNRLVDFSDDSPYNNINFGKFDIGKQQLPDEISYQIDLKKIPTLSIFIRQYKRSPNQFNGNINSLEEINKFIIKESSFDILNAEENLKAGEYKSCGSDGKHQCKQDL